MLDAEFLFADASVAVSAVMSTITVPFELTTTSNVYVVPDPAKLLTVGELSFAVPVAVISLIVKSLTVELKAAV